jgi:hypothetical protein
MAIQLARSIGEQRKPISPLEGLADIIAKTGEDIQAGIEKKQEAEKAKTQREQALKDAASGTISVLPIKASPQQQAEYERYVKENLPKLALMQRNPNVTPAQYQDAVNNFKYNLKDREIKYGEDLAAFEELYKREKEGTHSVKEYEDSLAGTPDREEIIEPETTMQAPYKEKSMMDVEPESEEAIAQPTKKTIKGQQGYFNLPFEEQKKIDTKKALEEKTTPVMPYMLDAAKGMLGKDYDFSYVITTDTSKGGKEFDVDLDKLEKDAIYSANMFASPPEIAPNKEFELLNRGIERQAITELLKTRSMADLAQNPQLIAETKFKIAYDKFKGDAAQKIYQDQLKLREEREKGKGGGMTLNFGQAAKESRYSLPEQPLDEKMRDLETDEIRDYKYYPIQGKGEGSNKLIRSIANFGNVAVEGVYKNAKTNKIDYIKIVVPAKTKKNRDGTVEEVEPAKTKYVRPAARELAEMATEVGETYFYGRTKAERPVSETIPTKKKEGTKPATKQNRQEISDQELEGF